MNPRPRYHLELEAIPSTYLAPAHRRLARLLKVMKRGYGFHCTSCKPEPPPPPKPESSVNL